MSDLFFLLSMMVWFFIGRWSRGNAAHQEEQFPHAATTIRKTMERVIDRDHPESGILERPTAADLKARDPQHKKEVEAWKKSLGPDFGKKHNGH